MKLSTFNYLTVNIVILFLIAILSTFIGDNLHSFFGDELCKGRYYDKVNSNTYGCLYSNYGEHDPTWHWGYRHWLYSTMCVILFIVNTIRIEFNLRNRNNNNHEN